MIYTIFFRKLQKKFGVAIQTMGYPESQKVYTPHLDIEDVQRENDNYYHCENENDSKNDNENDYHYDSKNDIDYHNDGNNVGDNHFHLLCKCGIGIGVVLVCYWYWWYWCEMVCCEA